MPKFDVTLTYREVIEAEYADEAVRIANKHAWDTLTFGELDSVAIKLETSRGLLEPQLN